VIKAKGKERKLSLERVKRERVALRRGQGGNRRELNARGHESGDRERDFGREIDRI
jgi:hypothetical protein